MNIKLVTGASTFEACVNTIKQIDVTKADEYNLLVVPDAFSMQAENLLFDVLGLKSVFNVEVVGISKLAGKILRDNRVGYVRVSGLEEIFNVFKAVRLCEKDFQYFGKCDIDFCTRILQIIKQLKGCKVTPAQIRPTKDDVLDRKMHDVALVYEKYDQLLGDKLDLSKMLEYCNQNMKNDFDMSKTNLFFANFDSFSLEINSFVCKLAQVVNSVCIGVSKPLSPNNAFIFEDDIRQKTMALAKDLGVLVQTENFETALDDRHKMMEQNLFGFTVKDGAQDDYFLNVIAKNKQDEVDFVAKYIKNAVFCGEKFKNFAVAVADDSYYDKLDDAFAKFDIAFYSDEAVKLSQTVLGRFLLRLLEMAKLGLGKEEFQFLASCPLVKVEDRDAVLSAIRYFNIEDKEEFLKRFPNFADIINQIDLLEKAKTTTDFVTACRDVLDLCEEGYSKLLENLSEKRFFKEESQNSQALSLVLQVLEKLEVMGNGEQIDLVDFENLFTLSLDSVKVETIPTYIDAVYVGNATTSYFEDVKTLFVLGATANALPQNRSDTGIIDDDDIEKLRLNFVFEPQIKVINRRSRLKLFECLLHAKEKLVICAPAVEEGRPSALAGFVQDLKMMFGENVLHTAVLEDIGQIGLSEEQMLKNLEFFVGVKQNLPSAYTLLKTKQKLPARFEGAVVQNLDDEIYKDEKTTNLSSATRGILLRGGKVSASQLETYFHCPFRHFVSYGLKIKENEDVEPNRRLFGVFGHAMLERFVSQNQDISALTPKEVREFIDKNTPAVAKSVYDEKVLKRRQFLPYLKNEVRIILENAVYEQKYSSFKPKYLEQKILQDFVEGQKLVGFVDRADTFENRFRIIDYKTGKTQNIKKDLFYGRKLQLLLYAKAMQKKLGLDCAGVYYFDCQTKYTKKGRANCFNGLTLADEEVVVATDKRVTDENFKSDIAGFAVKKGAKAGEFSFKGGNPIESFDDLFDYATDVSAGAIRELKDGFVLDKPAVGDCTYCPYKSICRHEEEDGFRVLQSIEDKDIKGT